jgi:hypothetical protein
LTTLWTGSSSLIERSDLPELVAATLLFTIFEWLSERSSFSHQLIAWGMRLYAARAVYRERRDKQ